MKNAHQAPGNHLFSEKTLKSCTRFLNQVNFFLKKVKTLPVMLLCCWALEAITLLLAQVSNLCHFSLSAYPKGVEWKELWKGQYILLWHFRDIRMENYAWLSSKIDYFGFFLVRVKANSSQTDLSWLSLLSPKGTRLTKLSQLRSLIKLSILKWDFLLVIH